MYSYETVKICDNEKTGDKGFENQNDAIMAGFRDALKRSASVGEVYKINLFRDGVFCESYMFVLTGKY